MWLGCQAFQSFQCVCVRTYVCEFCYGGAAPFNITCNGHKHLVPGHPPKAVAMYVDYSERYISVDYHRKLTHAFNPNGAFDISSIA